ncbi:hypothetical protein NIM87_18430 [Devosia sp. XJ19-1]|uniref:Uncharacterized protein n=1 Tax=Devosia ureilytica TaxID=2952754 RepID=A0A9Q4ARV4_9HYPH|nr:hypothetical protein [Devosia ureilytica]MCP8885481.1 hypothetical protein [Devosia ureilytica]MCP8889062.1 hypothetical protein [Devosia ureilytica]
MIFQVIDLRSELVTAQVTVEASSPEDAARQVLGIEVYRATLRRDPAARVYWDTASGKNMVRLYAKLAETSPETGAGAA